MKALEESASGNNEAAAKHPSISRRTTYHNKSLKIDKVGQKLSKRLKPSWHHTKREIGTCTRSKITDDGLFVQNPVFTSATECDQLPSEH